MNRPSPYLLCAPLFAALLASACGSDSATPTTPTATAPAETTETFDGTVTINGAATHPFAVQRPGTVTVRFAVIEPDSTAVLSLSLGTWNGAACQWVIAVDAATQGTTVTGTASTAGSFCARILDVGKLTAPASYQIVVTHF